MIKATLPMPPSRYPAPDRSNFKPNQYLRDPDIRSGDLGGNVGTLADGRPYRIEPWFSEGTTYITLFFSVLDLEAAHGDQLLALVMPVLERAAVPPAWRRLDSTKPPFAIDDASGNRMFSLTFVVGVPE